MSRKIAAWRNWIARRRATLFLVGGILVVLDATVAAVPVITDTSYPLVRYAFSTGFILAFVGLLGLYPEYTHRHPRLARLGAVSAGLGAVGFSSTVVMNIGQAAGVLTEETPVWLNFHVLLIVIGFVGGYLAFGIASLRGDRYQRRLGIFLLIPGVLYVVLLIGNAIGELSQWIFLLTAADAAAMLGIGYLLRTEDDSTD